MAVKKKVVFYNKGHIGDLHLSRHYVRLFPKWFPQYQFSYLHGHHPIILADTGLPMFNNPELLAQLPHESAAFLDTQSQTIYFNTWVYAAGNISFCTFQSAQGLMQKYFQWLIENAGGDIGVSLLDFPIIPPDIDYERAYVDIDAIDNYFRDHYAHSIFICNNYTANNQSYNDNLNFFIKKLAEKAPGLIYLTNKIAPLIDDPKVKYAEDLLGNNSKMSLNALSYFSTKCSVIIGRGSGPFTFAEVEENLDKIWFSMTFPHVACDRFNGLHLYSTSGKYYHTQDEEFIISEILKNAS